MLDSYVFKLDRILLGVVREVLTIPLFLPWRPGDGRAGHRPNTEGTRSR